MSEYYLKIKFRSVRNQKDEIRQYRQKGILQAQII